jgi:hypothetical protein
MKSLFILFCTCEYTRPMNSGLWIIVIIPAIIAFLFAILVTVSMVVDISARTHMLNSKVVGHVVRLKVLPSNT